MLMIHASLSRSRSSPGMRRRGSKRSGAHARELDHLRVDVDLAPSRRRTRCPTRSSQRCTRSSAPGSRACRCAARSTGGWAPQASRRRAGARARAGSRCAGRGARRRRSRRGARARSRRAGSRASACSTTRSTRRARRAAGRARRRARCRCHQCCAARWYSENEPASRRTRRSSACVASARSAASESPPSASRRRATSASADAQRLGRGHRLRAGVARDPGAAPASRSCILFHSIW